MKDTIKDIPTVDVVICTPAGSIMPIYVKCLLQTFEELNKRQITWAWSSEYSSHVADAREITLSGTMRNSVTESKPFEGKLNYKKLFWIDSDIAWKPEDFMKLYESDKDIISGAYLLASGEVTAYKEALGKSYIFDEIKDAKELIKVHSTGFGFLCIKQGVFESMTRPWFQSVPVKIKIDNEEMTFPIMGEDISFCHRANQLGYEVWLDPTVQLIHHKTMKLTWEGPKP